METSWSSSTTNIENVKKELFANVMKGDWEKVITIYKEDRRAPNLKITKSGHTALHLAASSAEEDVVEELVEAIKSHNNYSTSARIGSEALSIGNDRGHTALHFAAAMGNLRMCKCIASVDPLLIGNRNIKGETPLFWAVIYGQREAFLCLNAMCLPEESCSYCRRADGQTILHCAIFGEDFELALQIIRLHTELVNNVDEEGNSPLHTLASKPSCFRSGTNFGRWGKILYNCIYVDQPKLKPLDAKETIHRGEESRNYPENYQAFVNFILLMKNIVRIVTSVGLSRRTETDIENPDQGHRNYTENQSFRGRQGSPDFIPANNATCFEFGRFLNNAILVIFGYGHSWINAIKEEKKKHLWAVQLVHELLKHSSTTMYDNEDSGASPPYGAEDDHREITASIIEEEEEKKGPALETKETAILVAAKNGVSEIVDRILKSFPVAIHDADKDRKNVLLLAAENRRLEVFKLLLKRKVPRALVTQKFDDQGNSALHLAAMRKPNDKLWPIPGAALQMQWETKWYKFVEKSMPPKLSLRPNIEGKTPDEIFSKTHEDLVERGSKWLTTTSTACSVVATLIATVAFASCTTLPGGFNDKNGKPTLENQPSFDLFITTSLVALCSSVTSLILFLAILTSRHQEEDFTTDLPRKLVLGLTSLFISILAMLISFCSGHFLVLEDKLRNTAFFIYAVTFLPISLFAAAQFPLYIDLIRATVWSPF